jgi:hypothetical protein
MAKNYKKKKTPEDVEDLLTGPHSVASYDMQGDDENLIIQKILSAIEGDIGNCHSQNSNVDRGVSRGDG